MHRKSEPLQNWLAAPHVGLTWARPTHHWDESYGTDYRYNNEKTYRTMQIGSELYSLTQVHASWGYKQIVTNTAGKA
jgi:hypothetical protein